MADRAPAAHGERLLAIAGATAFVLLAAAALLLWAREGSVIYLARIISELPNCL